MSKAYDNAKELNFINFDSANNKINFSVDISTNGAAVVDATAGVYANGAFAQANAAFNSANNVAPQIQPAFDKANSAFNAANNASDTWVRNQANLAYTRANNSLSANVGGTVTGDVIVTGIIRSGPIGGDEGGQIELANAVTNQSLAGNVAIDIYQNRLRIFETAGTNRGVYLDLANNISAGIAHELTKYNSNTSSTSHLAIPIGTTAQRPASPANGHLRYNTTLNRIEGYLPSGGWQNILSDSYQVEVLIVAGGGAGGAATGSGYEGGGGGAGGLLYYGSESPSNGGAVTVTPNQSYTVTVGAGGAGSTSGGSNGAISVFGSYTATGGGSGGHSISGSSNGMAGGSGGGGLQVQPAGAGTPSQGYPGGAGTPSKGGGGGGAAGPGGAGSDSTRGGGQAALYSISGTSIQYAGGGAGALAANSTTSAGGGAAGGNPASIANRGSGGGGAYNGGPSASGGNGSSGVVIVRYLGNQRGTGGTITSTGGYTIHTFTGSGTFLA